MSLSIDIEVEVTDTVVKQCTQALVDSGENGCFFDIVWARLNNVPTHPLVNLILVYNVDSTTNEAGMITEVTDLVLHHDNHSGHTQFLVTCLGKQSITIGCAITTQGSVGKQRRSVSLSTAVFHLTSREQVQYMDTEVDDISNQCMSISVRGHLSIS
jgi:hypothetical protein